MQVSNNSVLRFYFKNIATVKLSKNRAVQLEFSQGKGRLEPKFKRL